MARISVPRCPRVTEEVYHFDAPSPRTYSEFQDEMSRFEGYVKDVRDELLDIADCIAACKKELKENSDDAAVVAECNESIAGCNALRGQWLAERPSRKTILSLLRQAYRKGLKADGTPRYCLSRDTWDKQPCHNPRQYIGPLGSGKWDLCQDHR